MIYQEFIGARNDTNLECYIRSIRVLGYLYIVQVCLKLKQLENIACTISFLDSSGTLCCSKLDYVILAHKVFYNLRMFIIERIIDSFSRSAENTNQVITHVDIAIFDLHAFWLVICAFLNLGLFFLFVILFRSFNVVSIIVFFILVFDFALDFFLCFYDIRIIFFRFFVICRRLILKDCIYKDSNILKSLNCSLNSLFLIVCVDIEIYIIGWCIGSVVDV